MADLDSLIGCKISLISHQDIRYDGTLFSINQQESSIVLKDVQAFGTEDRVTEKSKQVPASAGVMPFVTFPGGEIKDLYVHETSAPPAAPAPAAPAPAPKTEQKPKNDHKSKPKNETVAPPKPPTAHEEKAAAHKNHTPAPAAPAAPAAAPASSNNKHSGVGTGSHLLKLKERKDHSAPSNKIETTSDFNFQESLSNFKKEEVLATVAEDNNADTKKYVKDDFFDNLGGGDKNSKGRLSAAEERQLNQDTFGAIALSGGFRGRGGRGRGGRGSGRGGRGGRGGGRGRGNNNNNNRA